LHAFYLSASVRLMAAKKKKPRKRHNLAGVAMADETWEQVHILYVCQKRPDETFAAWVRRKLQS
jgi:hypothetical protein